MRRFFIFSALAAIAAGGAVVASNASARPVTSWEIGPTISGRNLSSGVSPTLLPGRFGRYFDFPYPSARAGHVNYVTAPSGSLLGKSRIVMRYRIDAAPGVRIVPRGNPRGTATLSLYFQRLGDNWSSRGRFEHYRWYAVHARRLPLTPGEHQISLPLAGGNWKSLQSSTGLQAPAQFREAQRNAARVGFVLGGGGGAGHGAYATGPARFTLLSFRVE